MITLKRKPKVKVDIDSTIKGDDRSHAIAMALLASPELFVEQTDAMQMAQVAALILDDCVEKMADGMFRLFKDRKLEQLYKNAYKANTRLLDALLGEMESFENKTDGEKGMYNALTSMAYDFEELMKVYYWYLTAPEDKWRQDEVVKTLNRVIGEDAEKKKLQQVMETYTNMKRKYGKEE